ncbi:hypothetical protein EBB59_08560 [Lysobacter pythonis]|uniref:Uncharacterized protein n=1 Tax=Solilutibacter pythonis TaxID=2483112 RepID=A0A3M2HTJ1_9GAMM|nr:hypothetical protein [Lysobacter pythonis]RMH90990.1 hypothetical protein EBB59_08560 [Lysobacter pythonis]
MNERNQQGARRQGTAAPIQGRRWVRDSLFTVLGMTMALSLSASAEWQVRDKEARSRLTEIRDSHKVESESGKNEIMKDPGELKMKGYDNEAITNLDKGQITASGFKSDSRCQDPGDKGGKTHQSQYKICQELVSTELAQYQYSLEMYERAKKRHEDLAKLEEERSGLKGYEDYGKLQANTNKMLALQTQLQIDHLQNKSYMDAYAARIQYLKAAEVKLADRALNGDAKGNKSLRDWVVDGAVEVTAGVALKEALGAVQTKRVRNN